MHVVLAALVPFAIAEGAVAMLRNRSRGAVWSWLCLVAVALAVLPAAMFLMYVSVWGPLFEMSRRIV